MTPERMNCRFSNWLSRPIIKGRYRDGGYDAVKRRGSMAVGWVDKIGGGDTLPRGIINAYNRGLVRFQVG
jgi:hypothetical protein